MLISTWISAGLKSKRSKLDFGQLKYIHVEHFQMGTKNCDFPKSHESGPFEPNGTMRILYEPIGGLGNPIEEL